MSQINLTIDVTPDQLASILAIITGVETAEAAATPAPAPAAKKAAPAAKKAAPAKKAAAPKPDPEPEEDEEESDADEADDAPTVKDALDKASEVMDAHGPEPVRAALKTVKVGKVGQLKPAQVQDFLDALEAEIAGADDSVL